MWLGCDVGGQGDGHIAPGMGEVNVRCLVSAVPTHPQLVGIGQEGMGAYQHTASAKEPEFVEPQDDAEVFALDGRTTQCLCRFGQWLELVQGRLLTRLGDQFLDRRGVRADIDLPHRAGVFSVREVPLPRTLHHLRREAALQVGHVTRQLRGHGRGLQLRKRLYAVLCGKRRSHFAEAGVNG
jgi:hypothetical protein